MLLLESFRFFVRKRKQSLIPSRLCLLRRARAIVHHRLLQIKLRSTVYRSPTIGQQYCKIMKSSPRALLEHPMRAIKSSPANFKWQSLVYIFVAVLILQWMLFLLFLGWSDSSTSGMSWRSWRCCRSLQAITRSK